MPTKDKEKQRAYQQQHYRKNKGYYANKRSVRKRLLVEKFNSLKQTWCCAICHEDDEVTFDLHHYDPSEKESLITRLVQMGTSWKKIVAEIEKCVCLCANCHRKVHKHEEWAAKIGPDDKIVVPEKFRE